MRLSAYVPCYNNAATLRAAVESVLQQTLVPDEVLVVDDGSSDYGAAKITDLPVRIVKQPGNLGRGAARARAMVETQGDLVLCCDATNILPREFAEVAARWFEQSRVAAVFGRISDPHPQGVAGRWRSRHLFKDGITRTIQRGAVLSTYGAMVRRSSVERAGGYDPALRYAEDADLGSRLTAAGGEVIYDPALVALCNVRNSLRQVLERYWRWHAKDERIDLFGYLKTITYAVRVMARADLARGDLGSAAVSLVCPHYCFARSALAQRRNGAQA